MRSSGTSRSSGAGPGQSGRPPSARVRAWSRVIFAIVVEHRTERTTRLDHLPPDLPDPSLREPRANDGSVSFGLESVDNARVDGKLLGVGLYARFAPVQHLRGEDERLLVIASGVPEAACRSA